MIPLIKHSRSQLQSHLNEYEDHVTFFVSSDTYPELFSFRFPEVVAKAPNGWRQKKMAYLWFPSGALAEEDLENINEWREKYKHYVLLGLNQHIDDYFSDELDFCMALDFNYDPAAEKRTIFGEAEYQLKYQKSRQHFQVLGHALVEAVADLPIPIDYQDNYCISCVPGSPTEASVQYSLASAVAKKLGVDFVDADLHCPKPGLKGITVAQKIPIWQNLYNEGCIQISGSVEDRLVVVIDDLYQSGATLWMYAKFLKEQGATHVIGLPCVKSLRDSDNQ
jgi:predicted amidophosphoribosyltransferase